MIGIFLAACFHPVDIPAPTPVTFQLADGSGVTIPEDPVATLAAAVDVSYPVGWRTFGPCLVVYGAPWFPPLVLRCGRGWGQVDDVVEVVERLRSEGGAP